MVLIIIYLTIQSDYYTSDNQSDGDEDNEPQSDDEDNEHKAQFSEGGKPKNRCPNVKKWKKTVCTTKNNGLLN